MAAPTHVATYSTGYAVGTTPTATVTTAPGDVLVALATTEDASKTLTTPTGGTGITWTLRQSSLAVSDVALYVWTAAVSATNTAVSVSTTASASCYCGMAIHRYSGSDGIGASATPVLNNTGAPSLTLTTTGANSAVNFVAGDWNAADGASRVWLGVNGTTPTAGNGFETTYARSAANSTAYGAYWPDVGAAGAKTVGLSAPSTGLQWTACAVEVLGTAGGGGGSATPPPVMVVPSAAVVRAGWW